MTIDKATLGRLHRESRALVEALADRLPEEKLERLRTFSFVGEWGLLVESLCATLIKRQIPIAPRERDALAAVLAIYPEPGERYPYWANSSETLASLNVLTAP